AVGIVEERHGGAGGAYTTAEGFAAANPTYSESARVLGQPPRGNQLRIITDSHDEQTRKTVAGAVSAILKGAGVRVQSEASVSGSEAVDEGHLGPIVITVLAIAIALGVIGGIGLGSTMSANVLERTREFGIMHAIGARPETVRRIVVAEGVFLALASCVV